MKLITQQPSPYASSKRPILPSGLPLNLPSGSFSPIHNIQIEKKESKGTSIGTSDHENVGTACAMPMKSVGQEPNSSGGQGGQFFLLTKFLYFYNYCLYVH